MVMLLYGAGLRLLECLSLRVEDVDFSRNEILVREGKGQKDPHTMLPAAVKDALGRYRRRSGAQAVVPPASSRAVASLKPRVLGCGRSQELAI
jgi:integrase